ncbi:hypothetical protein [Paraburkholderia pallida]|uniref:Uncharacterized protein n=1 Tax=Paraburkholderia pallida TaxID=2547399 RepID=A0A4P7D6K6_9BURK|nr:hypothetical protein [Paraburkholderia pallida]QBR04396.1 hypothetical protein E1956_45770 [Paraburkholderia pallida]
MKVTIRVDVTTDYGETNAFEICDTGRLATKGNASRVLAFVRKKLPGAVERLASLVRWPTTFMKRVLRTTWLFRIC